MAKTTKKSPQDQQAEEAKQIVQLVLEALKGGKTPDARRELVAKLMVTQYKRGAILRIICPAFGIKPRTVDEDIAWVNEWMLKNTKDKTREKARAESVALMEELVHRAVKKEDLQAAIMAGKHKDTVLGVVRDEDAPSHKLGVVMLPSVEDLETWAKRRQPKK